MDNHLLLGENGYKGQGPIDYLCFRLREAKYGEGKAVGERRIYAFFSLKHALCRLLSYHPALADRDISGHNGHELKVYQPVNSGTSQIDYAKTHCIKPGKNEQSADPGIYLVTDLDADRLRVLTGMPFPGSAELDDPSMIPLAYYNKDFTAVIATPHLASLQRYAMDYLHQIYRTDHDMVHQLVFKGKFSGHPTDGSSGYVEHHYYNNITGPVHDLISTNPKLFDNICADNELNRLHHFGYIVSPDLFELTAINVMSPDDCPDGSPVAGIYLHTESDIAALEAATGISFKKVADYDPQMPFLLLAEYSYSRGYRLTPEPSIGAIVQSIVNAGNDNKEGAQQNFTTIFHYDFHSTSESTPVFGTASDYYHYDSAAKAVMRLLSSDLSMIQNNTNESGRPCQLVSVNVIDEAQRQTLVSLDWQSGGDTAGLFVIRLQVDPAAKQLMPDLYSALSDYVASIQSPGSAGQGELISIPIASVDSQGQLLVNDKTLLALRNLTSQPQQLFLAMPFSAADAAAEGSHPYYIQLEWQPPATEHAAPTSKITLAALEEAYAYLQQMDPQLFTTRPSQQATSRLLRASLFDEATQTLIVSRFYQPAGDQELAAGFYLQYNLDHPQANKLVQDAGHQKYIESASSPHVLTYAQQNRPPADRPGCHQRHFRASDDDTEGQVFKR